MLSLRYGAALKKFRLLDGTGALLGAAVALLHTQPVTPERVEEAAGILRELRGGRDTETRAQATFLLARLESLHRHPARHGEALRLYDELAAESPSHALGQLAVVKAGALRIFSATDEGLRETFDKVAEGGRGLTHPDAIRDFHLTLADAATLLRLPEDRILAHLLKAERAGLTRRKAQADLLIRIGRSAERLGEREVSRAHFGRFLETFPLDPRAPFIREMLSGGRGGQR